MKTRKEAATRVTMNRSKRILNNVVQGVIENNRLIADRISELERMGFSVRTAPMGSGGVGQIKRLADGRFRKQISYAWGRNNYAYCVYL